MQGVVEPALHTARRRRAPHLTDDSARTDFDAIVELEQNDDLHLARLLVLVGAFAGESGQGTIEGLTKVAKLDFLLRYPRYLERALARRHANPALAQVEDHERSSVESRMIRYKYGPWDHRYRRFINLLVAKGLATVHVEGRTIHVGLTAEGVRKSHALSATPEFGDIDRRSRLLKTHLGELKAKALMEFVYATFPEISTLRYGEAI